MSPHDMDELQLSDASRQAYERMVEAATRIAGSGDLMVAVEHLRAEGKLGAPDLSTVADAAAPSEQVADAMAQILEELASQLDAR